MRRPGQGVRQNWGQSLKKTGTVPNLVLNLKTLVSVAGFDPSAGAGVLLDIKVFQHFGFHGAAVLTSLTAQNTQRVTEVRNLSSAFVLKQYRALSEDIPVAGIKVGMLGSRKNIRAVAGILGQSRGVPKVIDPVFRSSSRAWLLERSSISAYMTAIMGKITLLTPNLEEASLITGNPVKNVKDMKEAAKIISHTVNAPCLIKGGHLRRKVVNLLFDGNELALFEGKRIEKDVHGTGCFLSSAILCYLAKGKPLAESCFLATEFTRDAIQRAFPPGKGRDVIPFPLKSRR